MPRQRAKASKQDVGGTGLTDEEIMEERRRADAFVKGDLYLQGVGWGLWVLAIVWFLGPGSIAPSVWKAHLVGEAPISLLCCGILCGSLSKASPRGTWSSWRRPWQLAWSGVFGSIAVTFTLALVRRGLTPSMFSWVVVAACGGLSAGGVMTCPTARTKPAKWSGHYLGRLVLVPQGVLGLLIAGRMFLGLAGLMREPFGLSAVLLSALPLGMCSLASILAATDKELVAVLPPIICVHILGLIGHAAYQGPMAAAPDAVGVVVNCLLYLPIPNPESNPFHIWIRAYIRDLTNILTNPLPAGFDDNE